MLGGVCVWVVWLKIFCLVPDDWCFLWGLPVTRKTTRSFTNSQEIFRLPRRRREVLVWQEEVWVASVLLQF